MLVAMAGLPGTGKSTLAARLAEEIGGVVLNKDAVRATLFPGPVLDYSREEDDLVMAAIFAAATHIRRTFPKVAVFLDGRTFLKTYQIQAALALAETLGEPLRVIECVCSDEVVRQRLEDDLATGSHPAKNRSFALYLEGKQRAAPLSVPRLTLDTGTTSLAECVRQARHYLLRE